MSLACTQVMAWKLRIRSKDMARQNAIPGGSRPCPFVELQHSLRSHIASISPAVDLVMNFVAKFRKLDGSEVNIEVALHEVLTNGVVHGNHEDPDKLVCITCRCSIDGEVSITVRTKDKASTGAPSQTQLLRTTGSPLTAAEFTSCER
jgi:two-component sensor histidine kinase